MKKCDKCKKVSIETTREGIELCEKHYNTIKDKEESKPKKEVSINDYILL